MKVIAVVLTGGSQVCAQSSLLIVHDHSAGACGLILTEEEISVDTLFLQNGLEGVSLLILCNSSEINNLALSPLIFKHKVHGPSRVEA